MPWIQVMCLLVGLVFSLDFAYKLAVQTYSENASAGQEVVPVSALTASQAQDKNLAEVKAQRGFIPVALFLTLATAALLWLFVG